MKRVPVCVLVAVCLLFWTGAVIASEMYLGQTVYGGACYQDYSPYEKGYSRVTIRNVSTKSVIRLTTVNFYDPDGNLVKEYLEPGDSLPTDYVYIGPLASATFLADTNTIQEDLYPAEAGRPSFIVKWDGKQGPDARGLQRVQAPIIETSRFVYSPLSVGGGPWVARVLDVAPGTVIEVLGISSSRSTLDSLLDFQRALQDN